MGSDVGSDVGAGRWSGVSMLVAADSVAEGLGFPAMRRVLGAAGAALRSEGTSRVLRRNIAFRRTEIEESCRASRILDHPLTPDLPRASMAGELCFSKPDNV